jgi:metal-responsive CopG/Arc/MetJ family transcriptional regulator
MRNGTIFQLVLSDDLDQRVRDFRHANRINSRSEAMRELLERGLAAPAPNKAAPDAA